MSMNGRPSHDVSYNTLQVHRNVVCAKSCVLNQVHTQSLHVGDTTVSNWNFSTYDDIIYARQEVKTISSLKKNVLVYCQTEQTNEQVDEHVVLLPTLEPQQTQTVTILRGNDESGGKPIVLTVDNSDSFIFGSYYFGETYEETVLVSSEDAFVLDREDYGAIKLLGMGYAPGTVWFIMNADRTWRLFGLG